MNTSIKLALGTVQFGCDYGVSNNQGQVSLQEVNNILSLATEVGITTL
ncbi:MAG: aldo/keto reductase, partial [Alteromonadaceae bacterium]|nr:aldo/keto reductase [Alteromonadaceae bacterium]